MNDTTQKIAAELHESLKYYTDEKQRIFIIQSAIEKATEPLGNRVKALRKKLRQTQERLTECVTALKSRAAHASETASPSDTKRLDWLDAGNGLDLFLNSHKWRTRKLRKAIDAAMKSQT